jgi:hypothetical protein
MIEKKGTKVAKILSLIVIISAIATMLGWFFDISVLKSISQSWVTMKFNTTIAFILSGISLYFIVRALEGEFDMALVILSVTSLLIVLFMGISFFSAILGIHIGADDLIIKEVPNTVKTVIPGRPSIATIFNFFLIAFAAILTMWKTKNLRKELEVIGIIIILVSLSAVIGYISDAPYLYYYIAGINSAMAFNTAILFILLGTGLLCL